MSGTEAPSNSETGAAATGAAEAPLPGNLLSTGPGPVPASGAAPEPEPALEPSLPPLTPQEFRIYNRLAEKMDYFHEHFRQMYNTLQTACTTNRRPSNMSLKQFLDVGLNLAQYLEMHHTIEETHLYPLLGRKMPEFRATTTPGTLGSAAKEKRGKRREECELLRQHRVIHEGMDEMADYLRRCKSKECEFEMAVLREKMDSWGDVLLEHLDQEVRELGAEKMRRYWTLPEMRSFPI